MTKAASEISRAQRQLSLRRGEVRGSESTRAREPRCNCTVCTKVATLGAIVKPAAFRLLSGERNLTAYEWGGKTAKRYFCKTCGVTCFGRGHLEQLGGDYVSVNLNALDDIDPAEVKVGYFDGRHNNWQAGLRDEPWPIRA